MCFWAATRNRTHLPLGLHGAILPLCCCPRERFWPNARRHQLGSHSTTWFQPLRFLRVDRCGSVFALVMYYLVWKYIIAT